VTITDEDYPGADQVDFIDGFFVVTQDGEGTFWKSAAYDGTDWTGTDYATAEGDPDNVVAQLVDHREIWLFGSSTTEVWWNEGVNAFPFSRLQNAFIERGCAARFSVAKMDNTVFWLGDDRIVYLASPYNPQRVSTHAIEQAIQGYSTVSDAYAFAYTDEGHKFYVLTFPTEDVTWCYDMATQSWHEREYYERNKVSQELGIRHRANTYSRFNDCHVVGDYKSGILYKFNYSTYTDGGSGSSEQLTNGDFSAGSTGWDITGSGTTITDELNFTDKAGTAKQDSVFESGTTYTLTFDLTMTGDLKTDITLYNGSGKDEAIGTIPSTVSGDTSYSFTFTTASGTSDGAFFIDKLYQNRETPVAIHLDNFSIGSSSSAATIQRIWSSGVIQNQEKWSTMAALQVVFEAGTGLITGQGSAANVMMQYSDDGGKTWSNEAWRSIGAIGRYKHRSIWRRLGKFRSRIFRWVVSDPIKVVVLAAYGE